MYFRVNIRALIIWAASQLSESKSYEYPFDCCTCTSFPQLLKFIKIKIQDVHFLYFCRLTTLASLELFSPLLTPLFTGSSQDLISQVWTRPKDATSGFIDFRSVCYFLSLIHVTFLISPFICSLLCIYFLL